MPINCDDNTEKHNIIAKMAARNTAVVTVPSQNLLEFDNYKAFSIEERRPRGRGKTTVARYKGEMTSSDYVPGPHACLLRQEVEYTPNSDGDDTDFILKLWLTGGYASGDENIVVGRNKKISEI